MLRCRIARKRSIQLWFQPAIVKVDQGFNVHFRSHLLHPVCFVVSLTLLTGVVFGGGRLAYAQSFEDELHRVLVEHPRIRAAEQSLKATEEGVGEARAAFLPTVTFSGDAGYEYINSPDRRETGGGPSSLPRTKGTATATQNLFSGFGNSAAFEVSKLNSRRAALALERIRQQLTSDGINAQNDVVRDSQLVQLATLSERTIARQLNLEDERVERGSGIAVDVLLAKTRLQLAKERRVTFEGSLVRSITRYQQVFGNAPAVVGLLAVDIPPSAIPPTLPEIRESGREENLELREAKNLTTVAIEREVIAEADFYPTVDLVGSANYEDNVNTNRGIRRDWSVLFRVNWELFSGFRAQSAASGAAFEKNAARATEADIRRGVEEDIGLAWQFLKTAQERSELLLNASSIAREVFVAREKLRAAGQETALNVLDAETEVFNARINQVRAEFDARRARTQLLFSMGQLTSAHLFAVAPADKSLNDEPLDPEAGDVAGR